MQTAEEKIYPSAEVLCTINNNLTCPEESCNKTFTSEPNLTLHLVKTHKKGALSKKNPSSQYFCPDLKCPYNAQRYFSKLNALKQHYLQVHAQKQFLCTKCTKTFPTLTTQRTHSHYCGVHFFCLDCPQTYTTYETLITHSRRKSHKIHKKPKYAALLPQTPAPAPQSTTKTEWISFMFIRAESFDKCCQTDPKKKAPKRRKSQTTQTTVREPKTSAETQTVENYMPKKPKRVPKTSAKTQTKNVHNASGTEWGSNRTSSGTQTVPSRAPSPPLSTDFMKDNNLDNLFDTSFLNSETQTDLMFDDPLLNNISPDFSSNMYTQTCEDLFNLTDFLSFSHNQTQTAQQDDEDVLRCAETQTMNCHGSHSPPFY